MTGDGDDADVAAATRACEAAADRFTELLHRPPPDGELVLVEKIGTSSTVEDGSWRLEWLNRAGGERLDSIAGRKGTANLDEALLAHEIAHLQVAAALDAEPGKKTGYGSALPDWFEEGAAVWAEPPGKRAERLRQGKQAPGPLSLAQLAEEHPNAGEVHGVLRRESRTEGPCEGRCGDRIRPSEWHTVVVVTRIDGSVEVDTTWSATDPRTGRRALTMHYYASSYALLEYIAAEGGDAALDTLVSRVSRKMPAPGIFAGLPGLPATPEAMETAWHAWIMSRGESGGR